MRPTYFAEEAFKIALRILEKINSLAKGRIQVLKMASVPTSPAVDQKVWFCSGPLRNGTEDGSYRNENLKIFFICETLPTKEKQGG